MDLDPRLFYVVALVVLVFLHLRSAAESKHREARSDQRARELVSGFSALHLAIEVLRGKVDRLLDLADQNRVPPEPETKSSKRLQTAKSPEDPKQIPEPRLKPVPGDTRCPYCHDDTTDNDELAVCALCETRHHVACHQEHGQCSVNGCESKAVMKGPVAELRQAGALA